MIVERLSSECINPACEGSEHRRTVTDYVLSPRYRVVGELPAACGERVRTADGANVQFALDSRDDLVQSIRYRSSSCATLVAYAEVLGDLVSGASLGALARITPTTLIDALPGVPASRRDRARAVARAAWSALAAAVDRDTRSEEKGPPS